MRNETRNMPKRNWPLIWTGIIAALLIFCTAAGLVAMYIANFNLLGWLE